MKKKCLLVFGTRPEAIKMSPLVKELQSCSEEFETRVCVTAQHRQMLDQVLEFFEITPDYDLNLMRPGQNLFQLTADVITGLKPVLEDFKPDFVFVHGDTTTSTASSIAAFYAGAKVCHVEAGLRTYNKHAPFPEEINRQIQEESLIYISLQQRGQKRTCSLKASKTIFMLQEIRLLMPYCMLLKN